MCLAPNPVRSPAKRASLVLLLPKQQMDPALKKDTKGTGGLAGSVGKVGTLDNGGGTMGNPGAPGAPGASGYRDSSYYHAFKNIFHVD